MLTSTAIGNDLEQYKFIGDFCAVIYENFLNFDGFIQFYLFLFICCGKYNINAHITKKSLVIVTVVMLLEVLSLDMCS